jgi:hypothetical protein
MGFSGLRFGLLRVFESCFVVILTVKLGGSAVRFGRCAVKLCSLDVMWLRHERMSSEKQRHNGRYLNFLAATSVQRQARNLLKIRLPAIKRGPNRLRGLGGD